MTCANKLFSRHMPFLPCISSRISNMHFCGFSVLQACLGEATDTCGNQDVLRIGQVPPANDCYIFLVASDIHKNSSYK
jgi:hypothetical protein